MKGMNKVNTQSFSPRVKGSKAREHSLKVRKERFKECRDNFSHSESLYLE